jgi:hypothetical protein
MIWNNLKGKYRLFYLEFDFYLKLTLSKLFNADDISLKIILC